MRILITNDDGFSAPGIQALFRLLNQDHEVTMVAPEGERSAIGHGITLNEPLRMKQVISNSTDQVYAVSGTPADCIKLALSQLFSTPPDLVISGINPGCNAGININYSGTVGAAREAALNLIPSIAVSVEQGRVMDFEGVSGFMCRMVQKVIQMRLPSGTFLNINFPDIPVKDTKGIKITCQASDNLSKNFEKRSDPKDNLYYWYSKVESDSSEDNTDIQAMKENFISITPIQCDITNYKVLSELETIELN